MDCRASLAVTEFFARNDVSMSLRGQEPRQFIPLSAIAVRVAALPSPGVRAHVCERTGSTPVEQTVCQ